MDLNNTIERILVTEQEIDNRCKEMAAEISRDYQDKKPILLSLLRGSIPFVTNLSKYIPIPVEFDYMKVSSYHGGTTSTGNVAVTVLPASKLENRHIIVVEDIVAYTKQPLKFAAPKGFDMTNARLVLQNYAAPEAARLQPYETRALRNESLSVEKTGINLRIYLWAVDNAAHKT